MGIPLRILVVEDSEDDALLMLAELKHGGYDPVFVRVDAPEAMSAALREQEWDIVVSDYVMPRFSGTAALKLLQETGLDLPFIVVSGHIGEDVAVEAMRAGAHDYFIKGNLSRFTPTVDRELREAAIRKEMANSVLALRESEANLREAHEIARLGRWELDLVARRLKWSSGIYDIFEVNRESFVASYEAFLEYIHPEDRALVDRAFRESVEEKKTYNIEHRLLMKDGRIKWVCEIGRTKYDDSGNPICSVGTVQDITERKQTEEALRKSEERYSITLAAVDDGVWDWQVPSGNAFFNPLFYSILGYDNLDFPANYASWRLLVHPEDIDRVEKDLKHSIETGKGFAIDLRMKMKSNEWRWVVTRGKTVEWDVNGNVLRIVGTLSDITKRKQAEEALKASEERLDTAQDAAKTGVWDWNVVTGHIVWSTYMFRLFELDPLTTTASFDLWKSILHPDDVELAGFRIEQALRQHTMLNSDYRVVLPDGEIRWINATGQAKYDNQGNPDRMIGVCTDITERKLTEAALLRATERDRHIADVLQQTVMPIHVPIQPDGYDIAARYRPALSEAEVCGDFCDIFELGDGKIGVAIGDVVGKGLLGAVRVTVARNAIRCYAYLNNDPSTVMSLVNDALCKDISTENDMLTAFFAVLDMRTGTLIYSNAGHEPPLVRRLDGNVESLAVGGPMFIGMGSQIYQEGSLDLGPDDVFVMVTDGITESRKVGQSEQFGTEGITESLSRNMSAFSDQIAEKLMEDASLFTAGALRDDAAIIVIKKVRS